MRNNPSKIKISITCLNNYNKHIKNFIPVLVKQYVSIFLTLIVIGQFSFAQTPISLKGAIDTAIKNNALLKNEKLRTEYQKILISTGAAIPLTSMGLEYGQINSSYYDTKFTMGQSINFPTVYSKQKSVLNENWKSGLLQLNVKEIELKKQVSQVFYLLYYLQEKEKLLKRNDSFYSEFLAKSELRFRSGESNLTEKITAETQQGQIRLQLNQIKNDQAILQIQFKYLLNTFTEFSPTEADIKFDYSIQNDTSILSSHPTMKLLEQQKILSSAFTSLEKSRLLPDLSLAYSNMSMKGTGSDNVYYNTSTRFQSAQFGIAIPLFYGNQKNKIKASKMNEQIAFNNYSTGLKALQTEYQNALMQYLKNSETVNYYETAALKNAERLITSAKQQFNKGEIDYLDFVILSNQAIGIQTDYLDAIKSLNESIIALAYLSNKI